MTDSVLIAVGGALAAGLGALGVIVATVAGPARRLQRELGGFRADVVAGLAGLRVGRRRG